MGTARTVLGSALQPPSLSAVDDSVQFLKSLGGLNPDESIAPLGWLRCRSLRSTLERPYLFFS